MTRYKVTASMTYVVDLDDEDAVYEQADDLFVSDVESAQIYVTNVREADQ